MTAEPSSIQLSWPQSDIALLTFDAPDKGANLLSRSVLDELSRVLDQIERRKDLAGLVVRSAKPGMFIAGVDLREFVAVTSGVSDIGQLREEANALSARGQKLFARLSKYPFVTVAAIDGFCVGGGAELASWCDRRLMSDSPKSQYGFPEVKLGLIPGWGGTARLPRIVGLSNAIEMITSGESIDGKTAVLMGLATDVASSGRLQQAAVELVREEQRTRQYLKDRERWSKSIGLSQTELDFLGATVSANIRQQTKGRHPAPLAALEVMLAAEGCDIERAGDQETKAFAALFGTPINRSLLNVFFLTDRNKRDPGIENRDVASRKITSIGVLGAGIMGSGISAACLKRELPVTVTDAALPVLTSAVQRILEEVSFNKATRRPDAQRTLKFAPFLNATTVDAEFSRCDLVIEAVVENMEVKQELYARIESQLKPDAILASNTSAIPIGRLASRLKRPEQFCGIHFFNPVRQMQLVEVIRGPKTSDQTIATAVAFTKALGKSPIVVNDGPGFLVNRLLFPYMNEALELMLDGVGIKAIDEAAKSFGMPMGPITLYDVVGLDTAYFIAQVLAEAFPDRMGNSTLLGAMVQAGRLGQKSGKGFFSYADKKGRGQDDPTLNDLLQPLVRKREKLNEDQIIARLFLPMVLEASRVLAEGRVRDARDVDLGLISGAGFPPFKGGLLFWADMLGAAKIVEMLKPLESQGERYQPTPILAAMAKSGKGFYQSPGGHA